MSTAWWERSLRAGPQRNQSAPAAHKRQPASLIALVSEVRQDNRREDRAWLALAISAAVLLALSLRS